MAALVLICLQSAAAGAIVLEHIGRHHMCADSALDHLASHVLIVKLVTLAAKATLLGTLQLCLNGADARARAQPVLPSSEVSAGMLAATEV
jgi:hypothetical protein